MSQNESSSNPLIEYLDANPVYGQSTSDFYQEDAERKVKFDSRVIMISPKNSRGIKKILENIPHTKFEQMMIPAPADSNEAPKPANYYLVYLNHDLLDMKDAEKNIGARSSAKKIYYSSRNAVKLMNLASDLQNRSTELGIAHVGIAFGGEPAVNTYEGNGYQCPNSPAMWSWGDYNSSGVTGNMINGQGYTAWGDNSAPQNWNPGNNVRVAVIDDNFLHTSDSSTQSDWAPLFGRSTIYYGLPYRYNFDASNYNIQTYTKGANVNTHGRLMASLIFSPPSDGWGTAGVAFWAVPMALRINYSNYLWAWQVASAVETARSWGAHIINMSFTFYLPHNVWGAHPAYGPLLSAHSQSVISIAATGNSGNGDSFPAGLPEVMGVSGHDKYGGVSSYGSVGANTHSADIYANGSETVWAGQNNLPGINGEWSQANGAGTSSAAAVVSGACAIYYSQNKIHNLTEAINKVRGNAFTRPDGRKILNVYGGTVTP